MIAYRHDRLQADRRRSVERVMLASYRDSMGQPLEIGRAGRSGNSCTLSEEV